MKIMQKILLAFVLSGCISCSGDEDPAMTALAVQGIRAAAFPGAIRLTWNRVEDHDFLYAEVSYYDYGTQQPVTKLCSRYTNSLYIDGLLNKYGKYRFTFTAYNVDKIPGQPIYIEQQCQKAASYYVDIAENPITLCVDQLTTNAQEPSEGPLKHLVDGNPDTFFQSFWDEYTYPELKPSGYHWVAFDFRREVTAFKFCYWNRKKGGSRPKSVNIYGSTDGRMWELLSQLDNLPNDPGSSYTSDLFLPNKPVSQVKFEMVKGTDAYQPYFSLAEIEFSEIVRELVDPEAK
ncbi:discoidin domain-containing protein [Alistipes sp.]|uniref:discoidin domain-containing protein n=1 Tax=Alistipes sp. TaxID=1872444 RepID=UPI0025C57700|nr:discoidin domain-containing protein [Alistipes sp.]